ncbi:hypothetical protein KUTeg_000352 [Tegillarca granosa]|uniref:Vacuolar protein sorting-associated protein 11 homolog n=1 Tax=Tegillarca granosa TaxID=220873 RepID=A0ABQ9G0D9_TEGGR|nr:hypothetical protein KUTeg_000352 [Tegillarca granosa]
MDKCAQTHGKVNDIIIIMAFLQWRRFNFFDKEIVKFPSKDAIFDKLKDINVSACVSGRGQLVIGDHDGFLYLITRQLEMIMFKAYEIRVSHLYQMKQHNLLISIGEDEQGVNPLIKVWNLDKTDKDQVPLCTRITRAIPGNKPTPVTCLSVHENLNWMAVGFENGSVVLFKGDVTKDRHSKVRTIHENQKPITGLAFKTSNKNTILFIVTDSNVISITIQSKQDQKAVYFYQPDGRGPCLAFEGEKLQLHWFRGYLIVVGKENKPLPRAPNLAGQTFEMNIVTVYDIQNKFIAYSAPFPDVINIMCEWGSVFILGGDRKLYQLQEKDTQTKLEMLFKKNNYTLAISLAKSQQYDQDGLIDIFTQYGDHLYSKGDHDGAIDQYIKTIGKLEASYTKDREVDFDVETAIRVCRQASYYKHALFLAEKHQKHEWYLRIQLEDIKDYQKALEYIGKLEFAEAEGNLKKYGKMLMSEVPQQTTQLLKRLCTDYRPTDKPLIDQYELEGGGTAQIEKASAEEFIHIFVNNSSKLTEFLEHMVKVQPNSPNLVYNTLLELYLHDVVHEKDMIAKTEKDRKTLELLKNPEAKYDLDQALVLCQMNNYKAGILYLYEKAHLYQQILRYHMEHNEYVHVIDSCKRFGQQDSNLWVLALSYFARKEENCKDIDKKNLLPPLLDYIIRRLQLENDQIVEDERLIKQYREDTEKKRSQIEELKTTAKIFQASKCSICNHPLELPSVHFLCEPHSYHQHCFESYAENDSECPVCAAENRKIMDIIRAQEQSKDLHEFFHNQLERSQDGFSVVADYFGRGVFNKLTVITDSPARQRMSPHHNGSR